VEIKGQNKYLKTKGYNAFTCHERHKFLFCSHQYHTMRTRDFLEMLDPGRHYPDLDMPPENVNPHAE
jgi:hypothetical protein